MNDIVKISDEKNLINKGKQSNQNKYVILEEELSKISQQNLTQYEKSFLEKLAIYNTKGENLKKVLNTLNISSAKNRQEKFRRKVIVNRKYQIRFVANNEQYESIQQYATQLFGSYQPDFFEKLLWNKNIYDNIKDVGIKNNDKNSIFGKMAKIYDNVLAERYFIDRGLTEYLETNLVELTEQLKKLITQFKKTHLRRDADDKKQNAQLQEILAIHAICFGKLTKEAADKYFYHTLSNDLDNLNKQLDTTSKPNPYYDPKTAAVKEKDYGNLTTFLKESENNNDKNQSYQERKNVAENIAKKTKNLYTHGRHVCNHSVLKTFFQDAIKKIEGWFKTIFNSQPSMAEQAIANSSLFKTPELLQQHQWELEQVKKCNVETDSVSHGNPFSSVSVLIRL